MKKQIGKPDFPACYEIHDDAQSAILREKQLKKWRRTWKLRLIEKMNPSWIVLYNQLEP